MRRAALRFIALVGAGALIVAGACGGKLVGYDTPGGFDDAGVFHQPDGAVLFGPGSGCAGFDAAAYTPAPACSPLSPVHDLVADTNSTCNTWAGNFSIGYPVYTLCWACPSAQDPRCAQDAGPYACGAQLDPRKDGGAPVRCNPGPEGDAYCAAFYQQFVRGDGKAMGRCDMVCLPNDNCDCWKDAPYERNGTDHKYGDWGYSPRCPDRDFVGMCVDPCGGGHAVPESLCVKRPGRTASMEGYCADPP